MKKSIFKIDLDIKNEIMNEKKTPLELYTYNAIVN